jgi:hypothetical protein
MSQSAPLCELFKAHASTNRKYSVFLDEKTIQEHHVMDCLSFLDARKKFLGNKPKTRTQ